MFRALVLYLQMELHKQQLVYCVRIMSAGCYQGWSGTNRKMMSKQCCKHVYAVNS
jgi:hypothetical protein